MQKLQANGNGFLVGEAIEIADLVGTWDSMQSDLRAIRKALENGVPVGTGKAGKGSNKSATVQAQIPPQNKRASDAVNARNVTNAITQKAEKPNRNNSTRAQDILSGNVFPLAQNIAQKSGANRSNGSAQRDSKGRFQGKGGGGGGGGDDFTSSASGRGFSGAVDKLSKTLDGMGNAEQVDPAVKAFNEVAKPMTRGLQGLGILGDGETKEEKGRNRWYRRFFSFFKKQQLDTEKHQKEVKKSLKVIEEKPNAKGGGGSSFLGSALGGLFKGGGLLGAGGLLGGMLGGIAGSKFLRRLPVIGGLISGLAGLFGVWSSESSNMSRAEKDRATGGALGGFGGTLAGMWGGAKAGGLAGAALGTALAGPAGTAIGGVIGSTLGLVVGGVLGDKAGTAIGQAMGGFMETVRGWDIGGKAESAWAAITASAGYLWDEGTAVFREMGGKAKEVFDSFAKLASEALGDLKKWASAALELVSGLGDKANEWIKQKTGIDVKENIGKVTDAAGKAYDKAAQAAGSAYESAKEGAKKVGAAAYEHAASTTMGKAALKGIDAWNASQTRQGNKAALIAQMDAAGIVNPNERAAFMAQMHHESGGFGALQESFKYKDADRVMAVSKTAQRKGRAAVEAALNDPQALAELMYGGRSDLGNTQAGDGYLFRGRGFTQLTGRANYEAASKALGLDLVNNPDLASDPATAAKIATWFWQSKGVSEAARQGDTETVTRKINGGLNGYADRQALTATYSRDAGVTVANATNNTAPMPSGAPMPVPPAAAAIAPEAPILVASASNQQQTPLLPLVDAGQDISERTIAHIATGGIGGG